MSKTLVLLLFGFVALFYHLSSWKLGRQSEPIAVTSQTWSPTVHGSLKPVLVYFHEGDDPLVLGAAPKMAKRLQDVGLVVTADLRTNAGLALRYGIQELPTAHIFSNGLVVQRLEASELSDEWVVTEKMARFSDGPGR